MIANQGSFFTSSSFFEKKKHSTNQERICELLDARELHVG